MHRLTLHDRTGSTFKRSMHRYLSNGKIAGCILSATPNDCSAHLPVFKMDRSRTLYPVCSCCSPFPWLQRSSVSRSTSSVPNLLELHHLKVREGQSASSLLLIELRRAKTYGERNVFTMALSVNMAPFELAHRGSGSEL